MFTRNNEMVAEAAAEKHFDTKQYTWHKYTGERGTKLEGVRGAVVSLQAGDLYGVKEFTTKEDMYLVLKKPDAVFKVAITKSDKIMDKSREYKGKTPKIPATAPTKVKIDLTEKPVKKPVKKTVKQAAAPKKVSVKAPAPKLTATQKKIAKVKAEMATLKKLKQNTSNIRKLDKLKEELKKLRVKEKKENVAPAPKTTTDVKHPSPTSAPVNPHKETKKIAAKKVKIKLDDDYLDDDDDEENTPRGAVRYGGRLIEPDELEFDDDTSGFNLPIDESWSSEISISSTPMYCLDSKPDNTFESFACIIAGWMQSRVAAAKESGGSVYQLMLDPKKVFDLRKEECRAHYCEIRQRPGMTSLPELDSEEFILPSTGIPRSGFGEVLSDPLVELGYDAMLTVDDDRKNSIAIFQPSVISNSVKLNFS